MYSIMEDHDQAFSPSYVAPSPSPSPSQVVSLSQSCCVSPIELTDGFPSEITPVLKKRKPVAGMEEPETTLLLVVK
jgi:hypothetical protein